MSISAALVGDFEGEAANTRRVLEAVPEDRLDWKPHEKSMSLGQLAGHVAEAPGWVRSMMQDELDFATVSDYRPLVPEDRKSLLEACDENARVYTEALDGKDDAFMQKTWTVRAGDKVLMSMPRKDAVRMMGIHHMVHHRGQLTVYLRLLNVPVPGTYGPSADTPSES